MAALDRIREPRVEVRRLCRWCLLLPYRSLSVVSGRVDPPRTKSQRQLPDYRKAIILLSRPPLFSR
jgi:hypothetical protein